MCVNGAQWKCVSLTVPVEKVPVIEIKETQLLLSLLLSFQVYSWNDASKGIPEALYSAAQACSEQCAGWCGKVLLLYSSLLQSYSLKEELERKVQ